MAIHDNLTRTHILSSIAECDRLGQDEFLRVYGFGRAKSHFLLYRGRCYDSKAIVGVAHKFSTGRALPRIDRHGKKVFSGGERIKRVLENLGFKVKVT